MDGSQIVASATAKFDQASTHFDEELNKLRTGRAHPSMLEGIMVEAYGSPMPLIQVGSISVPEPTLLQISPFDPNNIEAISTAIRADQQLGLNPSDDGRVVRVPIPPLTTERRQQIVKIVKEKMEDANISMRNARHESLKALKDSDASGDDSKRYESQIDEALSKVKSQLEDKAKQKEEEILTV